MGSSLVPLKSALLMTRKKKGSLGVVGAHAGAVASAVHGLDAPVERVVLHQLEVHAALAPLHSLAPLELEPDDLPEVVLAAAADDAGLLLRGDGDGVAGRGALHRRGPHHVRVEQVVV